MCRSPSFIWKQAGPGWEQVPVPCKMCWQCEENYINDWTGRCLAEAQHATKTLALTLTYRDCEERQVDHAHKVLNIKHFQDFMKRLRRNTKQRRGYNVRYLVAGEYGSLRGRAHFHVLLFFYGNAPEIPNQENSHIDEWPHGHVFADWSADHKAVRYVAKYALKNFRYDDEDNPDPERQAWFSMSKKPLIGARYIQERALEYVQHGLFPSAFEYVVDGGKPGKTYMLTGAARRLFLKTIVEGYREKGIKIRENTLSEWVAKSYKKLLDQEHEQMWDALPEAEKTEILIEEAENKRPSQKAVMRAILGCEPQATPDLDWHTIHKRWKYGTAQTSTASQSYSKFSYDRRKAYEATACLKKAAYAKAAGKQSNAPPAYLLTSLHSASAGHANRFRKR